MPSFASRCRTPRGARRSLAVAVAVVFVFVLGLAAVTPALPQGASSPAGVIPCDKPVYLTFDTGHMGVAPLIADTLRRFDAKATFFLAQEPTMADSAKRGAGTQDIATCVHEEGSRLQGETFKASRSTPRCAAILYRDI